VTPQQTVREVFLHTAFREQSANELRFRSVA
jgi:hypothetical protein